MKALSGIFIVMPLAFDLHLYVITADYFYDGVYASEASLNFFQPF